MKWAQYFFCSLEQHVLYKVCDAVFGKGFIAGAGVDSQSAVNYIRPALPMHDAQAVGECKRAGIHQNRIFFAKLKKSFTFVARLR